MTTGHVTSVADPPRVDAGVVAAAQAGAAWALRLLYESLAPAVLGYARTQSAHDPEGVVNEVFLRAFRSLAQFSGEPEKVRSWVFSIAHNVVVDDHRRRRRRVAELPMEIGVAAEPTVASAEEAAITTMENERVLALLGRLPADQRQVLTLRLIGDLTIAEVAAVIGRSTGATKALQRRGLRRLQILCAHGGDVR